MSRLHRVLTGICLAATLAAGEVYEHCPEQAAAVRGALRLVLVGEPVPSAVPTGLDAAIAESVAGRDTEPADPERLAQLLLLRGALRVLPAVADAELAPALFERPLACSRLVHALDADDDPPAVRAILVALHREDPERFWEYYELALACAVVWDQYRGHPWAERRRGPPPDDSWRRVFRHFADLGDRASVNPRTMPYELGVYVVALRLAPEEMTWAAERYERGIEPGAIYRGVPWTKKLSPLLETGEGIPYTLPNIRRYGGACYEQAYLTESVLRLQGLPATMAIGRGRRGDHAWVGALRLVRPVRWDFSIGRYRYDHYFKGEVEDPTAPARRLPDSTVQLTAALMTAGSREGIERGHLLRDAADWVASRPGEGEGEVRATARVEALLAASLEASPYAATTWLRLRDLAGRLDAGRLLHWADELVRRCARPFPDFTAEWLTAAIADGGDAATRQRLCELGLRAVRTRPDLVAGLKVVEGDLHLDAGDLDAAVAAYGHPLRRFARDGHALDAVAERIASLDERVPAAERPRVYRALLRRCPYAGGRNRSTLREIRVLLLDRLIAHHRAAGDAAAAERYRRERRRLR